MVDEPGRPKGTAIEEARELVRQNRPADAARVLRRHLDNQAGTAEEWMLLGIALAQAGEGLAAIQPLEQAVALEPENAAAHFNLGQVYRQGGRQREALAAFERALQLRPDYPAAARAAEALRRHAVAPPPEPPSPPAGPARRASAPSFDPMAPYQPPPPPAGSAAPADDSAPVGTRLLRAVWQLVVSPGEAVSWGLDRFFNTPGAIPAVCILFLVSVGVAALGVAVSPLGPRPGAAGVVASIPFVVIVSILNVITTAGTIAVYNRITGGTDDFIADFGSLAMSFALISATITLVTMPLAIVAALAGALGGLLVLSLIRSLWTLVLQVMLIGSVTDIDWMPAYALLIGANFISGIITSVVVGALGMSGR